MFSHALASLALASGCPLFSEFLPDPQELPDSAGEFVEIYWEASAAPWDTLLVLFESDTIYQAPQLPGSRRLLLHRGAPTACPSWEGLECAPLQAPPLPNSRASQWTLSAGFCRDTAFLPTAKAGLSLQRSAESPLEWIEAPPSPGLPSLTYERGIKNCAASVHSAERKDSLWSVELVAKGCQGRLVGVEALPLDGSPSWQGSVEFTDSLYALPLLKAPKGLWLRLIHPPDDYPLDDTVEALLTHPLYPPLRLSEISPCPEEPMPEWLELHNTSSQPFPLGGVTLDGAGLQDSAGELPPGGILLLTRDSTALRAALGIGDLPILQWPLAYMRNSADTLTLRWKDQPLDEATWSEKELHCPESFYPGAPASSPSPGFQPRQSEIAHASLEVSSRILGLSDPHAALQARCSLEQPGTLYLATPSGNVISRQDLPASPAGTEWMPLPSWRLCPPGPCFLHLRLEDGHAYSLGLVVRP